MRAGTPVPSVSLSPPPPPDFLDRVPRVHPDTGLQRFGGRYMAVTPDGPLHTFDDEGAAGPGEHILALVDGQLTVGQIVEALLAEYEVDRSECIRDTKAFVEALIARRVLSFV